MKIKQALGNLKSRQDASQVLPSEAEPFNATFGTSELRISGNPDERLRVDDSRSFVDKKNRNHSVFVLSSEGNPLTPTTPSRARTLLKTKMAIPCWSRFSTFGIRLLVPTRQFTPKTTIGIDTGTKFEGYSVVCDRENNLSIKLDLPNKKQIVERMEERSKLRRARRFRNCRRRPSRFSNRRKHIGFIAPSQAVIVGSRLKIIRELTHLYPITFAAIEEIRFNWRKYRWGSRGKAFSTMEVGKTRVKQFLDSLGVRIFEIESYETRELREKYGYRKTSTKSADIFTAHNSDSLALAVDVHPGERVEPGRLIIVDDTYRPVRRRLHDTQPAKGNIRAASAKGTVFGFRKGLLIGSDDGRMGRLCGEKRGVFRYYASTGLRRQMKYPRFICGHFITRQASAA
jgi:hypothetical protein